MPLRLRSSWTAQEFLHSIELVNRYHRLMFATIGLTIPFEDARVERAGENLIDCTLHNRFAANTFALGCSQAPIIPGNLANLARRRDARQHEIPYLTNMQKTFGVPHDCLSLPVISVAKRGVVWPPAVLGLGAITPLHVLAQAVDVIF